MTVEIAEVSSEDQSRDQIQIKIANNTEMRTSSQ
jgi:hypothetical protein